MAAIFPRDLFDYLMTAIVLGVCVFSPGVDAAQASYYDCEFKANEIGDPSGGGAPLVLRFMLNTKLKIAFRIDTPMARPVRIFVLDGGEFSLLDNAEPSEIVLVTVRRDGRSVYSRHLLGEAVGKRDQSAFQLGFQTQGWCYPARRNA